jgi:5-methylcytosine-specific restriction enzyme A
MARNPNQHLYGSAHWRRLAKRQLREHPLCAACTRKGLAVPAVEADHVERHHGDSVKFFCGALQSLCHPCHEAKTAGEEGVRHRGYDHAIGVDGLPLDPRHPVYRR